MGREKGGKGKETSQAKGKKGTLLHYETQFTHGRVGNWASGNFGPEQ